ncbi:MAG: ABA4-like family protein [Ferruginibacter sp.]
MSNQLLFNIVNLTAMMGWLLLIFLPSWKWTGKIIIGFIIVLLASIYVYIIAITFDLSVMESFSRLNNVMALFNNEMAVLASWIHYLAFDLMVGMFIVSNAAKNSIKHWMTIPALLGSFMFGPAGLLLYFIIRWIKTRRYFMNYPETKRV